MSSDQQRAIDLHHRAVEFSAQGQFDDASSAAEQAIRLDPGLAAAHNHLGNIRYHQNRLDEALEHYRDALKLRPDAATIHNNIGNMLRMRGQLPAAIESYRAAIACDPNQPNAHNNLGNVLRDLGQLKEAIDAYQSALRLSPDHAEIWNNLGNAFQDISRLDDAAGAYARALELKPEFPSALSNLANVLNHQGHIAKSIQAHRLAHQLEPADPTIHSNLLAALYFDPASTPQLILDEHRAWAALHADPLMSSNITHANDRTPDRPLRIGYVSPDFRTHPVGRFLVPLLAHHDHRQFHITCFCDNLTNDETTALLKSHADSWHSTTGLSDAELASLVRSERIDILVDLALHMARNRMPTFARKPAPVQVTYLAYAGTSGMAQMDYRVTDPYLDPPGNDAFYAERSVRISTYWCYQPPANSPEPVALPAILTGHVTFGCLNNFAKINTAVLETWADLLAGIPGSRLILHARPGANVDHVYQIFSTRQVARDRMEFIGMLPLTDYLAAYNRIDIALDPFPYNGGTTSCDALWMGPPVVTLAGNTGNCFAPGVSLLTNIDLTELISRSRPEYVRIATELAGDRRAWCSFARDCAIE